MNPFIAALTNSPLVDDVINQNRRMQPRPQSIGGTLTNNVQPGEALGLKDLASQYAIRADKLYNEGSALANAEPDVEGFKRLAKQRKDQASNAILTALAAQFAGDRFAPIAEQSLQRASEASKPVKVGNAGVIDANGEFVADPFHKREQRSQFLLNQAKAYEQMALNARSAQERADATRQHNETMAELRRMSLQNQAAQISFNNQVQADAAAARKDKELSQGAQNLSKRLEDVTNLYSSVKVLNDRLTNYAGQGKQDLPGVGYGSDLSLFGLDISGPFLGAEGRENRAMVKSVANELLRLASGAAVTVNEAQRKQLELMSSGQYNDQDFLNAWRNTIVPKMNEALGNVSGGFSSDVKQRYMDQGGRIDVNKPVIAPGSVRRFNERGERVN